MATVKNNFNIELLNVNNYHTWKFRIENLLMEQGVFELVQNEFDASAYQEEKDKVAAQKKDIKCKSLIVQCIDDSQIDLVRSKSTAYAMMKTLEERYEKRGVPGQLLLRKKFMNMKFREGSNLEEFLQEFDNIIRELKVTGANIAEKDQAYNLLLAMPESFETVVTIIENLPEEDFKVDTVKAKLRAEVERRKAQNNYRYEKSNGEKAKTAVFYTKKEFKNTNRCYKCGKVGHFIRQCRSFIDETSYKPNFNHNKYSMDYNKGKGNYRTNRGRASGSRGNSRSYNSNYINVEPDSDSNLDNEVCFQADKNGGDDQVKQRTNGNVKNILFLIDSGCTDHLVNDQNYFHELLMLNNPIKIAVAKNDNFISAVGVGQIKVKSNVRGKDIDCTIKNVFYVPELRKNLLSVKKLEMSNIKIVFEKGQVKLFKNQDLIALGKRDRLYEISFKLMNKQCLNVEIENEDTKLWHKRLGHIGYSTLEKLIKNRMVDGIGSNVKPGKIEFCEACVGGKMTRLPFGSREKGKRVLEIVHSDVVGPITPVAHDGSRFFVTFIDDHTNFVCVYPIKTKGEVFKCFKEYVKLVTTKFNTKISTFRCDNGGEYNSSDFKGFCQGNGIFIDYSTPYTPEQNGKAERYNRTLVEKARTMIEDAKLPKYFWNEAVLVAAYLLNRTSTSNIEKTPAEMWYGRKPDVGNVKVFGCLAYSHIPKQFRDKFDIKTEKCILIGYTNTGYRLWNLEKQKIIVSRDVVFNEQEYYYKTNVAQFDIDEKTDEDNFEDLENINQEEQDSLLEKTKQQEHEEENRIQRMRKLPEKYNDFELYVAFEAISFVENVPQNVEELKTRNDEEFWRRAMEKEIISIEKNETWEQVEKPENAEILNTKWVYSFKPLEENIEDKFKARLVVRGFAQNETFNYNEIYSPVAKMATIRTLLAVGNQYKFYFKQLDIKTAFLNGKLNESIFIYPPKGVTCKNGYILKLKKSIYGLKQAAKCWNDTINEFLVNLGFQRSTADYCLYYKSSGKDIIFVLIYVDDIILAGINLNIIEKCKKDLMNKFELQDKGDLKNFLGLEIEYDRDKGFLEISQKRYLQGILKKFNFENCNSISTPIDPKCAMNTHNYESEKEPVRELVGCLMYLMLGSRPDISFSVNYYSRYQDKNVSEVWKGLKRLMRYLKGTADVILKFERKTVDLEMTCYVDSDWGGDLQDRKSVSGYLIKVFGNTVLWVTRKQNCVSLSSTEAELVALCSAVQDCLYFKRLLQDLGIHFDRFKVYEDNQGCIAIINNPENNRRIKHIDLKYNFISENVKSGLILVEYINTRLQIADILTKGLPRIQFLEKCETLGLEMRCL